MEIEKLKVTTETLNNVPVSCENLYNPSNVIISNLASFSKGNILATGGLYFVGNMNGDSFVRINKAFNSNGRYVISFDIKGTQNTNLLAFILQYNDIDIDNVYISPDNNWVHHEYVVDVTNYTDDIYNFIDFQNPSYILIYVKDIQIKKLNSVGYSLPVNMTVSNQIIYVNDANDAIENATTYFLNDNAINKPHIYGGIIKKTNIGEWIFQTFHGVSNVIYVRTYDNWRNYQWSNWKELIN